jgi:hypothetical protein
MGSEGRLVSGYCISTLTVVPRIMSRARDSGRLSWAKVIRAGSLRFAHDESRLRSKSAMGLPVTGSDVSFSLSGTSSAR